MTTGKDGKTGRIELLRLDPAAETERIAAGIRNYLMRSRRKGLVVALSGGIDSSVTACLCVRAVGASRVFGLLMPERDSSSDTLPLSRSLADRLGIETAQEDITPILDAAGCYRRRDLAIRSVIPEYDGETWKSKIGLSVSGDGSFTTFSITAASPRGEEVHRRLPADAYLGVVAATNFKQRVRKMLEYYHADRLSYAVAGTPNRLEYDQGFFVKLGDGAADIKPIAHLYKTQVFQLAAYLDVPEEIRGRTPTTDTYSLAQTQNEFYFTLPYEQMDICLYGKNHGLNPDRVAQLAGIPHDVVERTYRNIEAKRRATRYLHQEPFLVEPVEEIRKDADPSDSGPPDPR